MQKGVKGGWSSVNRLLLTGLTESCAWSPHSLLYSHEILFLSYFAVWVSFLSWVCVCEYITSTAFGSYQLEWRNSSDHPCLHVVVLCLSYLCEFWGRCCFLYVLVCVAVCVNSACVCMCVCVSLLEMCSSSLLVRLGTQSHGSLTSLGLGQEEFPWILKPTTIWLPLTYTYRIFFRSQRIHSAFGRHKLIFFLFL